MLMVLSSDNPWRIETETEAGFYGEQSKLKQSIWARLHPPPPPPTKKTNASYHFDTKIQKSNELSLLVKAFNKKYNE